MEAQHTANDIRNLKEINVLFEETHEAKAAKGYLAAVGYLSENDGGPKFTMVIRPENSNSVFSSVHQKPQAPDHYRIDADNIEDLRTQLVALIPELRDLT